MRMRSPRFLLLLCLSPLLFAPAALAQSLGDDQTANDPFGRVQFIHSVVDVGPLNVYLNGEPWVEGFDFRSATPFTAIPNGTHKLEIYLASDTTATRPFWTSQLSVLSQKRYVLAILGHIDDAELILRQNVRATSITGDAEFFVLHAAPDTGPIDIRLRDPAKGNAVVNLLQNNLPFGTTGAYANLPPSEYNFEVTTADNRRIIDVFHFNLSDYQAQPIVFVTSGTGTSASDGFALTGYDDMGTPILPAITTTAIDDDVELPSAIRLEQNYPNPFNPATQIQYALSQRADVRLTVYDLLGRTIQTLVQTEQPAGSYSVQWDGHNAAGAAVPSGIYLYRLDAGTSSLTRRMLLVK